MKVADHPLLDEINELISTGAKGSEIAEWVSEAGGPLLSTKQINDWRRTKRCAMATAEDLKILAIDIETSPILAYVWGMYKQDLSLPQIVRPTKVLCFAAKWVGESGKAFYVGPTPADLDDSWSYLDNYDIILKAWELLEEADVVLHYNGDRFDVPHLQREFLEHGLPPVSSFESIDLLKTSRKQFRFPSNKLQYVSTAMGLEGKISHSGFSLWTRCMDGDPKAWRVMAKYNRQDVDLLEELYYELLPWITGHPNLSVGEDNIVCVKCKSENVQRRGLKRTKTAAYPEYQCSDCRSWFRGSRRELAASVRI